MAQLGWPLSTAQRPPSTPPPAIDMAELTAVQPVVVQQAVAVPVQAVPVSAVPDTGTEWLGGITGLFLRQSLEIFEAVSGCETKNKYNIVPLITPIPAQVGSAYTRPLRDASNAPLLKAKEESECCERVFCPLYRGFQMNFADAQQTTFFSIERPCVFEFCPCWGCFHTQEQNLSIKDRSGQLLYKAREPPGCMPAGFAKRKFIVDDAMVNLPKPQ